MNIEGHRLPLLEPDNPSLDVWRIDKEGAPGVAITISDQHGHCTGGVWVALNQWKALVANIRLDP